MLRTLNKFTPIPLSAQIAGFRNIEIVESHHNTPVHGQVILKSYFPTFSSLSRTHATNVSISVLLSCGGAKRGLPLT